LVKEDPLISLDDNQPGYEDS